MDERKLASPWSRFRPRKPKRIQGPKGWMRLLLLVRQRGEILLPSLTYPVLKTTSLHSHTPLFNLLHRVERSFYLIKGRTTRAKSTAETIDNRAVMSLSFLRSDMPINLLPFNNAFF
jgi:hypothetical protein